jgi:hypothetical protein
MSKVFAFSTRARPRVSQCCAAHLISGNGCSGNEGRPKTPSHKRNRGRLAEEDGKQVLRGAVVFTRCTRNAVFELPRAEGVDPLLARLRSRVIMSLATLKKLFSTSLTRERPELSYSEAELRKGGVWKSEPLERELSHKLSQNRH